MCNDPTKLCKWQADCLKHLMKLEDTHLSLLIVNTEIHPAQSGLEERWKQLISKYVWVKKVLKVFYVFFRRLPHNNFLYLAYCDLFSYVPASELINVEDMTQDVPSILCKTFRKGKYSQFFQPSDLDTIRRYSLDFIIRFGFGIIRGDILDIPRFGIWSYHHGDLVKYRGRPAAFWEIYNGDPVTGSVLQKLTDRLDGGVILRKGFFKTIDYKWASNIEQTYNNSLRWPADVCRDITNGKVEFINAPPATTDAPVYRPPSDVQFLRFLLVILKNLFKRFLTDYYFQVWNIGIISRGIEASLEDGFLKDVRWLPSTPKGMFYADPFPIEYEGKRFIFLELFDYLKKQG